ncbi:MAG: cysteine synthase family protein [Saprospiraceae bacterium]|nr:cysteine synthase family protein [Saprospiraceae bacterium]
MIQHTYTAPVINVRRLSGLSKRIGNTPLYEFASLAPYPHARIFGKLEWLQFGGSVKARAAYHILKYAITTGRLTPGQKLLDASSGNTGIAYATICAVLQIPFTLCLPENASKERIQILKGLGTELILTSRMEGTDGAQKTAAHLAADQPGVYYYADQYNNPRNWQAHFHTTAPEIYQQTSGRVTHFVTGLGTTGSFTGSARRLQCLNPKIRNIGLQPESAMHGLEGWKHLETARIPGIYDAGLANEILPIDTGEAFDLIRFIARHEGLIISPSAAANLLGAQKVAATTRKSRVVTLLPDNGDKYSEVLSQIL